MPNHRIFLNNETLPALIGQLALQGLEARPRVWTISHSKHDIPYARAEPFADKDKQDMRKTEDVVLQGAPAGAKAIRLETGASHSCPVGSAYLVSDGFASCVAVMGVTKTTTYLVHIDKAPPDVAFKGWDREAAVMILRKKSPAVYHEKVKVIREYCMKYFFNGADVDDIGWYGSTGVIAFRSTWIAYLESSSQESLYDEPLPLGAAAAAAAARG
jgi:hypothetical protein